METEDDQILRLRRGGAQSAVVALLLDVAGAFRQEVNQRLPAQQIALLRARVKQLERELVLARGQVYASIAGLDLPPESSSTRLADHDFAASDRYVEDMATTYSKFGSPPTAS